MKKKPVTYAVVDVETTGLRAGRDRITEVGVVMIREGQIIGTLQKLINPGVRIREKIVLLTGIGDEMVGNEPGFEEFAEEFDALTQGSIIAGHHVAFDYSFLKFEMSQSGLAFSRKTICTYELARFLFPQLRSYSLRYLCAYFGIRNDQPHRALPDALATAHLFQKLMQSDRAPDLQKIISGRSAMQFLPNHIRQTIMNEIPGSPGIYYFIDRTGKPLYIGKAANLRSRVISHFRGEGNSLKILAMAATIHKIKITEAGSTTMASLMEDHEIRHYWPPWNDAQKKPNFKFGVTIYTDMAGRKRLAITQGVKPMNSLRLFHQYHQAADFIRGLVKTYSLMGPWCGVPEFTGDGPDYHERNFGKMIAELFQDHKVEIFFTRGRSEGEKGFIWIENNRYRGLGFIPDQLVPERDQIEPLLTPKYSSITTETILVKLREQRMPDLVFPLNIDSEPVKSNSAASG